MVEYGIAAGAMGGSEPGLIETFQQWPQENILMGLVAVIVVGIFLLGR